jgi:hypothetical protein
MGMAAALILAFLSFPPASESGARLWRLQSETPPTHERSDTVPQESLSEKLKKGNGVVVPPSDIDPRGVKPAPDINPKSTPIIPPPAPQAK